MRSLLFVLAFMPSLALAQIPGDYRLDGEDNRDDPYTAEVSISRVQGEWALTRTAIYWKDERRVREPVTWVAAEVTWSWIGELRVRFGGQDAGGMAGVLQAPVNAVGKLDEPVTGTYTWLADGRLRERLESDDEVGGKKGWDEAEAIGGRDHPTLKLIREAKFEALLGDALDRYEASGVARGDAGELVVVFDNATEMARVHVDLDPAKTRLVETDGKGASDFEGITYDRASRRFFTVVEADRHDGDLSARIWELDADLELLDKEWLPYEPPSRGKGFEGLVFVHRGAHDYLLALLEGNHGKSDERSIDRGHGKVVVFKRDGNDWDEEATFDLPPEAAFSDYAGIDVRNGRLAVVSQTSSLMWVGELSASAWQVEGPGRVYRFPREHGVATYGSVEGVAWLSHDRVAVVSDRYHGKVEPCEATDQSVHIFRIPK